MEETNQAVAENVEETTSQASSPQAKEPEVQETTQETESGETKTQEFEEDSSGSDLPEMTNEQREAFQRMRQENKRLKEEVEARKKHESAFATFRSQGSQNSQITFEQFADPNTGQVDWNGYNLAVQRQASAVAQQQVEEKLDEYEARQKYPELFNDPEIEEELASMWFFGKYKGENVSIKEIAERYARRHNKAVAKAQKKGAEEALTELSAKEKASLEARGQNASQAVAQQRAEDAQALRERVRYGDANALTNLMSNVPWEK